MYGFQSFELNDKKIDFLLPKSEQLVFNARTFEW